MTSTEKVIQKAIELVEGALPGKRYSELVKEISAHFPDIPVNTVHGALHKFRTELPPTVYQPSRGLYRAVKYREEGEKQEKEVTKKLKREKIREEDFYGAFGDWLINELEECTKSISVGGNRFKDKWGTPDVIGVREARRSDIIKPPTEIVSAEVKLDPSNLITAFGQACSYRLFSHKSYIAVPDTSSEDERVFASGPPSARASMTSAERRSSTTPSTPTISSPRLPISSDRGSDRACFFSFFEGPDLSTKERDKHVQSSTSDERTKYCACLPVLRQGIRLSQA